MSPGTGANLDGIAFHQRPSRRPAPPSRAAQASKPPPSKSTVASEGGFPGRSCGGETRWRHHGRCRAVGVVDAPPRIRNTGVSLYPFGSSRMCPLTLLLSFRFRRLERVPLLVVGGEIQPFRLFFIRKRGSHQRICDFEDDPSDDRRVPTVTNTPRACTRRRAVDGDVQLPAEDAQGAAGENAGEDHAQCAATACTGNTSSESSMRRGAFHEVGAKQQTAPADTPITSAPAGRRNRMRALWCLARPPCR